MIGKTHKFRRFMDFAKHHDERIWKNFGGIFLSFPLLWLYNNTPVWTENEFRGSFFIFFQKISNVLAERSHPPEGKKLMLTLIRRENEH